MASPGQVPAVTIELMDSRELHSFSSHESASLGPYMRSVLAVPSRIGNVPDKSLLPRLDVKITCTIPCTLQQSFILI